MTGYPDGSPPAAERAAEAASFFYAAGAACRARPALSMLRAACSSAGAVCPQRWQMNSAWLTRFSGAA